MFRLDIERGELLRGSVALPLRPKTLAVLRYLLERAGAVVGQEELREAVWGKRHGNAHGPKQCIRELRVALGDTTDTPRFIETVGRYGYRLVGDIAVVGNEPPARSSTVALPAALGPTCVGRDRELGELAAGLTRAQRGSRSIHFVAGETGAGKTTLVDSFIAGLARRHDVWIAQGQCVPHHGPREPYEPLLDMAVRLAEAPVGARFVQLIRNHAPTWLTQLPTVFGAREVIEKRAELTGTGPERMTRELTDVIERLTQHSPGIIVLEDLQWADASTLGWICAWALRRAPARLMVLATYRSDEAAGDGGALATTLRELNRVTGFRQLELAGLSTDAVTQYLDARFPRHVFPPALGAALAQRTEGHPIFLTALLDEWLARGDLRREDGSWSLRSGVAALAATIPASARVLIDHQIARLTRAERQLLEAASAAGQEFSAAALGQSLAETEAIEQQCEDLARRELFIRRLGSVVWPDETAAASYAFRHALYQQAIYEQLPLATRNGLHRRIGLRLEAAYGARVNEIAASLADHFEHASDRLRAALFRRQAGETALQRRAADEAAEQFGHALNLLSICPEGRARSEEELLTALDLGLSLMVGKGLAAPGVAPAYGKARELAVELADKARLMRALRGLWVYGNAIGDVANMEKIAAELEATLGTVTDAGLTMWTHNIVGRTRLATGEFLRAVPHIEAVATLYDPGRHADLAARFDTDPGLTCHMYAAITRQLLGFTEAAERHFDSGMTIARSLLQPFGTAMILWSGALVARERGDVAAVRERALEMLALCDRAHLDYWRPEGQVLAGWVAVAQGDETGLDQIRSGLPAGRDARSTNASYLLALLADACGKCSRPAEGRVTIVDALDRVETTGARWYEAELFRLKGVLSLQAKGAGNNRNRQSEAIGDLRRALAIAQRQQAKHLELRAAMSLVQALRALGEPADARELLGQVCAWFEANDRSLALVEDARRLMWG